MNRNKWQEWYDGLSPETRDWLHKQPPWHDKDVALFCSIAMAIGFFLGWMV